MEVAGDAEGRPVSSSALETFFSSPKPGPVCRYTVSVVGLLGLALLQEALCSYRAALYRSITKPSEREVPFAQSRCTLSASAFYALSVHIPRLV